MQEFGIYVLKFGIWNLGTMTRYRFIYSWRNTDGVDREKTVLRRRTDTEVPRQGNSQVSQTKRSAGRVPAEPVGAPYSVLRTNSQQVVRGAALSV